MAVSPDRTSFGYFTIQDLLADGVKPGGTRIPLRHGCGKADPGLGRGGHRERGVRVGTPGASLRAEAGELGAEGEE